MSGNPLFHQSLVRASRIRKLLERRSMIQRARVYEQTRKHREILDLLLAGDVAGASYLMRHLGRVLARKRAGHRTRVRA